MEIREDLRDPKCWVYETWRRQRRNTLRGVDWANVRSKSVLDAPTYT